MKNKRLIAIVFLIVLIVLLVFGIKYLNRDKKDSVSNSNISEIDNSEETEEEVEHDLRISIVSPEEEIIIPGQARMYKAFVEGNGKYSNQVRCNWKFYLNEYNEEVLYEEMNNSGILSDGSQDICGFTSTFIDKVGTLRVVLNMTVYNAVDDNLETVTAEREYIVQR